jgi:hypothetical protein
MTTTVLELIANLKHYPDDTVVIIKNVDDEEFTIFDSYRGVNCLKIVIGQTLRMLEKNRKALLTLLIMSRK